MKKKPKKKKITIRCRKCFIIDSYIISDNSKDLKCRHCGSKIYIIDEV